jgi:hypothetical protein
MDRKAAACGASFLASWPSFECLSFASLIDSLVLAICDPLSGLFGDETARMLCVVRTQAISEFGLSEYSVLAAQLIHSHYYDCGDGRKLCHSLRLTSPKMRSASKLQIGKHQGGERTWYTFVLVDP